jgi:hypothetical protein
MYFHCVHRSLLADAGDNYDRLSLAPTDAPSEWAAPAVYSSARRVTRVLAARSKCQVRSALSRFPQPLILIFSPSKPSKVFADPHHRGEHFGEHFLFAAVKQAKSAKSFRIIVRRSPRRASAHWRTVQFTVARRSPHP